MSTGYDPDRHHRRSIRLPGYDYGTAGAYFVTICTYQHACLFGDVIDGMMELSDLGTRVAAAWRAIPDKTPGVALDAWVVMPNHIHGIIVITAPLADIGAGRAPGAINRAPTDDQCIATDVAAASAPPVGAQFIAPGAHTSGAHTSDTLAAASHHLDHPLSAPAIGTIVRMFKARVTVGANRDADTAGTPIWQRNYYEHIIRGDAALDRIRRYIDANPARWLLDPENATPVIG